MIKIIRYRTALFLFKLGRAIHPEIAGLHQRIMRLQKDMESMAGLTAQFDDKGNLK